MLERFRRESRAAAQLHHTNIVPIFDVREGRAGQVSPPVPYYARQLLRGQALDEGCRELQHLRAGSAPDAAKETTKLADSLAQSLWTGAYEPATSANGAVNDESGPA